ncbi:MAG: 2-oxoglutarate dehydrogenase component, partial [Actinomycetota bacterium]
MRFAQNESARKNCGQERCAQVEPRSCAQIGLLSVAGMTPDNKFGGSFGSNEWLVDEMYERYLADPNSVEENWREFFSGYKPGAPLPTNGAPKSAPGTPPVPKRQQSTPAPTQAASSVPATPTPQITEVTTPQPAVRPATQPTPTPAQAVAKPTPQVAVPS